MEVTKITLMSSEDEEFVWYFPIGAEMELHEGVLVFRCTAEEVIDGYPHGLVIPKGMGMIEMENVDMEKDREG